MMAPLLLLFLPMSARSHSLIHHHHHHHTSSSLSLPSFMTTRSPSSPPYTRGLLQLILHLRVIWSMGKEWSGTQLSQKNMHFAMSDSPEPVFLLSSMAKEERNLAIALAVHGFLMFLSWGILFPGGVLSARFLKHQYLQYLQYSGLAVTLTALVIAVTALGRFHLSSGHAKFGTFAVLLCVSQPINAYFRPKKPETGETGSDKRVIWEYAHAITGRVSLLFGIVGLFTGLKHFGEEHDSEIAERLTWGLVLWILISVSVVLYLEFKELQRRRRERNFAEANWELGELELELDDGELVDLLEAEESWICNSALERFGLKSDRWGFNSG